MVNIILLAVFLAFFVVGAGKEAKPEKPKPLTKLGKIIVFIVFSVDLSLVILGFIAYFRMK